MDEKPLFVVIVKSLLQTGWLHRQIRKIRWDSMLTWHLRTGWSLIVISLLDLKMTCTWVGRSVGSRGPLLGITVNSCATSEGEPSVASNAKLKLISNLPLFFREHVCFVSSKTLRTPKSRPPSAPDANQHMIYFIYVSHKQTLLLKQRRGYMNFQL